MKLAKNRIFITSTFMGMLQISVSSNALALDQIIRPYQSVRSAGMGGVRMTTGLYEENFFNNPARVTANPESRFTLLQPSFETSSQTLSTISTLTGNSGISNIINNTMGTNIHAREQLFLLSYYLASNEYRKWSLAIGIYQGVQLDAANRQSYQLDVEGMMDIGPAITYGRKFLNDTLSIGATAHYTYRLGLNPSYSILSYLEGNQPSFTNIAGDGTMLNFDLGATYKIATWREFEFSVAGAIQNILGGSYSNSVSILKTSSTPPPQPRSYGIGGSISRVDWWKLHNTVFALELTDVLDNPNGSIFKMIHLGAETHWRSLAARIGLNQGYLAAGVGLEFHYLTLNVSTYGEELGLNAGSIEDRRYAFEFGLHI